MCIVRIGSAAYVYTEFQVAWLTWLLCIFRWSGFRHVLQLSLWYYTKTTLEDARYNRPLFHIQNLINSLSQELISLGFVQCSRVLDRYRFKFDISVNLVSTVASCW